MQGDWRAPSAPGTVEKTADRLKPVTQEGHRLKSVVRLLAGFSSPLVSRAPMARGSSPADHNKRWSTLRAWCSSFSSLFVCGTQAGQAAARKVNTVE